MHGFIADRTIVFWAWDAFLALVGGGGGRARFACCFSVGLANTIVCDCVGCEGRLCENGFELTR
jgi:hypothetical protein